MVSVKRARASDVVSVPSDAPTFVTDGAKKRGRKPRGSKIIEGIDGGDVANVAMPNVIAHFRCSMAELMNAFTEDLTSEATGVAQDRTNDYYKYAEVAQSGGDVQNTEAYTANGAVAAAPVDTGYAGKYRELGFSYMDEVDKQKILVEAKEDEAQPGGRNVSGRFNDTRETIVEPCDTVEINEKIHEMEVNFHNNNINGKRSACFWDTCAFDTPPFYIPKTVDANDVRPYGCFCSLNCALAYLQNEDIDSSAKFERRQLMFNLYSNVVGDKTFVKPAPNPRFTLDKYYGNLTIQQWRSLLAGDRMLLIVDKPLTPELPQLHTETTDRFLTMGSTTTTDVAQYGKFKIRKVAPKQSKGAIVAEKFGQSK